MVRKSPSSAGGTGLTSDQGARIPHSSGPKTQNIKQKQCCNELNKDFKMVHIKKKSLKNTKKKLHFSSSLVVYNEVIDMPYNGLETHPWLLNRQRKTKICSVWALGIICIVFEHGYLMFCTDTDVSDLTRMFDWQNTPFPESHVSSRLPLGFCIPSLFSLHHPMERFSWNVARDWPRLKDSEQPDGKVEDLVCPTRSPQGAVSVTAKPSASRQLAAAPAGGLSSQGLKLHL